MNGSCITGWCRAGILVVKFLADYLFTFNQQQPAAYKAFIPCPFTFFSVPHSSPTPSFRLTFSVMKAGFLFISALSAVGALASGATNAPRATLATVYSSCVNPKQAALTFDDGPYLWL